MFSGYELIVVVGVVVVIFLWGPQKLPEMARAVGQAKAEYEKVAKVPLSLTNPIGALTNLATSPQTAQTPMPASIGPTAPMMPPAQPTQTRQDPIVIAAKSLGIVTEGKTKEQLAKEITDRTTPKTTSTTTTTTTDRTPAANSSESPKP